MELIAYAGEVDHNQFMHKALNRLPPAKLIKILPKIFGFKHKYYATTRMNDPMLPSNKADPYYLYLFYGRYGVFESNILTSSAKDGVLYSRSKKDTRPLFASSGRGVGPMQIAFI